MLELCSKFSITSFLQCQNKHKLSNNKFQVRILLNLKIGTKLSLVNSRLQKKLIKKVLKNLQRRRLNLKKDKNLQESSNIMISKNKLEIQDLPKNISKNWLLILIIR